MTTALAHRNESILFEDATNLRARKNPELPNRNLNLSDKNLRVKAAGDLGGRG